MRREPWYEQVIMVLGFIMAAIIYLALFAIVMAGAFLIARAVFE